MRMQTLQRGSGLYCRPCQTLSGGIATWASACCFRWAPALPYGPGSGVAIRRGPKARPGLPLGLKFIRPPSFHVLILRGEVGVCLQPWGMSGCWDWSVGCLGSRTALLLSLFLCLPASLLLFSPLPFLSFPAVSPGRGSWLHPGPAPSSSFICFLQDQGGSPSRC